MPRGGVRQNSGRPKGAVAKVKSRITAAEILESIDEEKAWKWALDTAKQKKDAKTYVDILKYLTDRRDGKPKQAVEATGTNGAPIEFKLVTHIPRPERDGNSG